MKNFFILLAVALAFNGCAPFLVYQPPIEIAQLPSAPPSAPKEPSVLPPAPPAEELKAYPSGRLGYIRAGYDLPADWIVDVWINPVFGPERKPLGPSSFILPISGGYEWMASFYGLIKAYAEARIWDQGRQIVVAISKVLQAEVPPYAYRWGGYYGCYNSTAGYYDGYICVPGYGWALEFQLRHFDLSYWKHYRGYQYPHRGPTK